GDARLRALLAPLDHPATTQCVTAERACLAELDGSCHTPIAAYAELSADGRAAGRHGRTSRRTRGPGRRSRRARPCRRPAPEGGGRAGILRGGDGMTLRALVTRPEEDAAPLAAALAERGIDVTLEPLLAIRPLPEAPLDLAGVQALLFTSANGVRSFAELAGGRDLPGWRALPVFAVGNATAAAAHNAGFTRVESAAGDVATLAKLATERLDPKAGALFHAAGSAVAGDLAGLLEQAGFTLRREMLYEARPADQLSPATVTNLSNGWFD